METRYTADNIRYKTMTTQELRDAYLINNLFAKGTVELLYCEVERSVVGSAVPTSGALKLEAGKELASDHFCDRREVGILNIGEGGTVTVDGTVYDMENLDCLYIGRGSKEISMDSNDNTKPAKFYILSYPAHADYPTAHAKKSDAEPVKLGSLRDSNERTIFKYIHPQGIKSCQLVMGITALEEGSVWNTMPCHTHERRTEVYLYFGIDDDAAVFHMMGAGDETKHIVVRDGEAVISPMWSIHSGAGTRAYTFCWGMGGENQVFTDMDHIDIKDVK
jgi:4-deoxy-L-threo-5-hexosulose-uronate ketol-isomerase